VDGVRFSFDPAKPEGSRILEGSVSVRDKGGSQDFLTLDFNKKYSVVSKAYLIKGKDGYDVFAGAPVLLDDERCPGKPARNRREKLLRLCTVHSISLNSSPQCSFYFYIALAIMFCNLFTEISILKRWEGMTVKATVVDAASKFKRLIRRSIADPYAISPVVDGRITNVAEVAAA